MILRLVAVAIALAGVADPVVGVGRRVPQGLTVTILQTPSFGASDESRSLRERAYRSAERFATELAGDFAVTVREQPWNSTADPCPVDGACVLVSDGARPRTLDARPRELYGVRISHGDVPNVAISAIDAPLRTDPEARARLLVHLQAHGVSDTETSVDVFDGDILLGTASHTWSGAYPTETARASVGVEWTPVATGLRDLRVVAGAFPNEAVTGDNEAKASVDVSRQVSHVLVYEPHQAWSSTFVRRALEDDGRFNVTTRARLGPRHTASSRPIELTSEVLEREQIKVLIVSAPHLLARSEVDVLTRWVRLRGGSVVLLLDAPPTGELAALVDTSGVERREAGPVTVGPLKASELIVLRTSARASEALARAGAGTVMLATPVGRGRVVTSGVLDAWRYRGDSAFDAFWRSLVADAAQATAEPLAIELSPGVAAVGEPIQIDVEWRSVRALDDPISAEATLRCRERETPVRLWPSGGRGRFHGTFEPPWAGHCVVTVSVSPLAKATVPLSVFETPPGPFGGRDELSPAIAAHGGTVVEARDEGALIAKLRGSAAPQAAAIPVRPMRSGWWIVPFAGCLGVEWWLRRRQGRR